MDMEDRGPLPVPPEHDSAIFDASVHHHGRRALTLLETLLAVAILLLVTTAVISALTAGRGQSAQARRTLSADIACEMLMARITGLNPTEFSTSQQWYDAIAGPEQSGGWDGYAEAHGEIRAGRSAALGYLPEDYQQFSLHVDADRHIASVGPPLSVAIQGVEVQVEARDDEARPIATVRRFVPVPQVLESTP